jgi:NAD(P)-dependent dehydrogenase (short-subunit alcohol dehydrogenase family)
MPEPAAFSPEALAGTVAVVTGGGAGGMGASGARALAAAGAEVIVVARDQARLDATVADITASGGTASALRVDVTGATAPHRIVEAALERHGRLDVIVHAAGRYEILGLEDVDAGPALARQWAVNVAAPLAVTAAAIPALRAGGRGSVVFFSSVASRMGLAGHTGYSASKGAVEAMVRSLAVEEGGRGVRYNVICPGSVRTPLIEHLVADPGTREFIENLTPLGRIGTPEEIAPFIVLLASGASRFMTGETIVVDGGMVAR